MELQLQQAMLYSDVSGEQMLQSMRDMIAVSSLVQSGQTIEVSSASILSYIVYSVTKVFIILIPIVRFRKVLMAT